MKIRLIKLKGMVLTALMSLFGAGVKAAGVTAAPAAPAAAAPKVRHLTPTVVATYPHDTHAYTQGLFFWNGTMYESTGQYGSSSLRIVDLKSGKVVRKQDISRKYFGEGSCVVDGRLYMLSWQNKAAFIYNPNTLELERTVSYPRDGWGLCSIPASAQGGETVGRSGAVMVASDGTPRLYFLDANLRTLGSVTVTMAGRQVPYLNELEWIDGKVWANVYTTDFIVVIDPATGFVEALLDCSGLYPADKRTPEMDVLNGIALAPDGSIMLTGKNWPKMFKITNPLK